MKKSIRKIFVLVIASVSLISCDLLNVESDRQVFVDEFDMKSANDTLYSMFGVFSQLEKLADSYVLLGELRGDLVDVTDKSNIYLNEINNFNVSSSNTYIPKAKDYYSIINSCNYIIHTIDTSVVSGYEKVMYREFAACKAIRAWTYMQLVLNYGSAIYYDKPILNLQDAETVQKQAPLSMEEIAPLLIEDLKPYKDIPNPYFGSLYSFSTRYAFFPIRFIMGDLYLWTGQYENAANEYHDLIVNNSYMVESTYRNQFTVTNGVFTGGISTWVIINSSDDKITSIAATNQYKPIFSIDSLTLQRQIIPSAVIMNRWDSQRYFYGYVNGKSVDTITDVRKYSNAFTSTYSVKMSAATENYISIYEYLNPLTNTVKTDKEVLAYRVSMLYMRYAEAVNRLGKPNLAFVVLKYGLTNGNILKYVPSSERGATMPNYMDFPNSKFDFYSGSTHYYNIGIRMRGCGNVNQDTTYYRIPNSVAKDDSIKYVEDMIEQELALDIPFTGNRFHDLMRFAIRRNDNAYLADKIAAKHKENAEAIRTKLMDRSNWYLKK